MTAYASSGSPGATGARPPTKQNLIRPAAMSLSAAATAVSGFHVCVAHRAAQPATQMLAKTADTLKGLLI